jgi:AcrR family transcriptional regulator
VEVAELSHQAAKSLATRNRVISAVIGIIKEQGFAAASSTRIARRAGVTWGAVQHHFGSKEAILQEVLEHSHRTFQETLDDPDFALGSVAERVEKYVTAAWRHYQSDEYMAAMEILLATRGEGRRINDPLFNRSRADHLALGRRIFHESQASDRQVQEAVYCVHCMLTGVLLDHASSRSFWNSLIASSRGPSMEAARG